MKKLLTLLLVCALVLTLIPGSLAETAVGTATARTQFNLRGEASAEAQIVGNVPQGATVDIMVYGDEWCRVKYRSYNGYAKTGWLRVKGDIADSSSATADTATGSDLAATPATQSDLTMAVVTGDGNDVIYNCMTRVKFNLRDQPDSEARRIKEIKKGAHLSVLQYADDWCYVRTEDGKITGYAMTKWLFHFASVNRFLYEVPGYDEYRMTGYVKMLKDEHITDSGDYYGGNNLQAGDLIFVKGEPTDTAQILLRREFVTVPAASVEYYPLVPWREAKAGDIIGGYTQFYGQKQGGAYFLYRKRNIKTAMERMAGTVIASGEEYSFLTNVGPVTKVGGYEIAGITGGAGSGVGGGICHTSTLMYQAALSLPFTITDREPHTDDGATYAPLEFDATVGAYSDMSFINTLPYAIRMNTYMDGSAGVITVMFECMETVDADTLANWDGSQLSTAQ